jgi:N-acetylmuramoyl-L-alanine amidase
MLKYIVKMLLAASLALFVLYGPAGAEEEHSSAQKKTASAKKKTTKAKKVTETKKKGTAAAAKKGASAKGAAKKKPLPVQAVLEPEAKPAALVKEFRSWSNPDNTRIAVTLDREAHFEYHRIGQDNDPRLPGRLYIDISGAHLTPEAKDIPIADGLLKTARIAQYRPDIVRVVLDFESIKDYKVFTFSDPFRILVDVRGDRRSEISAIKERLEQATPSAVTPGKELSAEKLLVKRAAPAIGKIRRVVVDPGHGGHDPGAIGGNGTREKDVVLTIGIRLARLLREELGLDVVMTRSTDVFLELQERTALANQVGADLFISVHANAAPNRASSGIETYYLSLAKTEKAAQLAAKENGTSLEKVSMLQAVLFDLMANYKINDSAHLAEVIQKDLHRRVDSRWPVKSLGVKQGPFYVLVGANMPSVLVETAFLSNEKEEQRLQDPQYLDVTAEGIMEGVRTYMAGLK